MTRKIPPIAELVKVNRIVNRRLYIEEGRRGKRFLVDAEGNRVNADLTCEPRIIEAAWNVNPFRGLYPNQDNRLFSLSCGNVYSFRSLLTRMETKLALGKDYSFDYVDGELRAVIEAATGGPRVANAYLLGAGVAGMHQEHGYSVLPVLYYRINPRRHKELGIESDEKKLASLIAQVENERNR